MEREEYSENWKNNFCYMVEKVAIVTGADGGMGRILVTELAKSGCKVIMACINKSNAQSVCDQIIAQTATPIELFQLNLASIESVRHFVNEVKESYPKIDLLLNNAGVLPHKAEVTDDGYELTTGVNYLGHCILTTLLLPLFSKGARIVNMSSFSYTWFPLSPHFLQPIKQEEFNRFKVYSNSKLALVYFTLDMAEVWKEREIYINCSDPGIVDTGIITMGNKVIDKLCDLLFRPLINTPAKGAETMLWLALSPEVEGRSGGYYVNKKQRKISKKIINGSRRQWLRELTDSIIKKYNF